jgi:hypothetical protein
VRPLRLLAPVALLALATPLVSPGDAAAQSLSEIQDRLREAEPSGGPSSSGWRTRRPSSTSSR